jgi:hypothetical protein
MAIGENQTMKYVITTVHGTFARKAKWIQPDSLLCKSLKTSLRGEVIIAPFIWSGRNSISGRARATRQLQEQLRRSMSEHPSARHYVVAHSHGGNVAMYAMKDDQVARGVAGIACLSTPFIHASKRLLGSEKNIEFSGRFTLMLNFFALSAMLMLTAVLAYGVCALLGIEPTDTVVRVIGMPITLVLIVAGLGFSAWMNKSNARVCASLDFPTLQPRKLLIIRAASDEASAALGGVQFIAWVSHQLYRPVAKLSRWLNGIPPYGFWAPKAPISGNPNVNWALVKRVFGKRDLLFSLLVGGIIGSVMGAEVGRGEFSIPSAIFFGIFSAFTFHCIVTPVLNTVAMLAIALEVAVLTLQSVFLFPFGPEMAVVSFYRNLSVETTPSGDWNVKTLSGTASEADTAIAEGLAHSAPYDDPRTFRLIHEWILARTD